MGFITDKQRKKLFKLAGERGLDNDELHGYIKTRTGRDSIRQLTVSDAIIVIDGLGPESPKNRISASQKRLIYTLARELGWTDGDGAIDTNRLREFVSKRFGISDVTFLGRRGASNVIEALKAMNSRAGVEAAS